jgi:LacI family transcriptional regulator
MKGSTLKDVAREADVSVASASRVMNGIGTVTEDVRARVLEAAERLRYVPHWGARSLVTSRTNTVGLLLPDIYGEFFSEIIRGVDIAARARDLHLLVSGSHGDLAEAAAVIESMSGRVDGLLVMSPVASAGDLPVTVPLVTIGGRPDGSERCTIGVDNFAGACTAVRHLAANGCRRLAHISGPAENLDAQERFRGFAATASEVDPGAELRVREGDFTEEGGHRAMAALLDRADRPDGVFVANDMMAAGAILAIKEAGLAVPEDVAVIGFDDIPLARFTSPPLSTLRVGVCELGKQALEMLVSAIEAGDASEVEGIVISPQLVVRESSKRGTNTN